MLCQGTPLCKNSNDLMYCNSTLWDATNKPINWTPMAIADLESSKCSSFALLNKTEDPHGQWIYSKELFYDGKTYNCINRLDERPFERVQETKPWLGNELKLSGQNLQYGGMKVERFVIE